MKRDYIEPMLIVEDFTVSEMVAANCTLVESDIKVVQQLSGDGVCGGWVEPISDVQKNHLYGKLSDKYEGSKDWDGDGTADYAFTKAYWEKSGKLDHICGFDPFHAGNITFGANSGFDCEGDSTDLHNS